MFGRLEARGAFALAIVAALIAGCATPSTAAPKQPTVNATTPATGTPTVPSANASTLAPATFTWWFTADHKLSLAQPAAGTVAESTNFFDPRYQAGATGDVLAYVGDPLASGLLVLSAKLDVAFSSQAPQTSLSPAVGFGPVAAWFGEGAGSSPTHDLKGPQTLNAGEVARVSADVPLPAGGLVIEKGSFPRGILGFIYSQNEGSPILVHVGGADGTRLTVKARAFEPPPQGPAHAVSFTGKVDAASPAGTSAAPSEFPLTLDGTVTRVSVKLTGTGSGHTDLDLALLDSGGKSIWASTTPSAMEAFTLYALNLGTSVGKATIRVTPFQATQASFKVDVVVNGGPEQKASA